VTSAVSKTLNRGGDTAAQHQGGMRWPARDDADVIGRALGIVGFDTLVYS